MSVSDLLDLSDFTARIEQRIAAEEYRQPERRVYPTQRRMRFLTTTDDYEWMLDFEAAPDTILAGLLYIVRAVRADVAREVGECGRFISEGDLLPTDTESAAWLVERAIVRAGT